MYYDWKKIFRDKSNEELLRIYKSQAGLPKSTIPFAEKELEARHFKFEKNSKINPELWRLSSLTEEEETYHSKSIFRIIKNSPLHIASIYLLSFIAAFTILPRQHILIWLPFFFALATLSVLDQNRKYRKEQEASKTRRSEIAQLTRKLQKDGILKAHDSRDRELAAKREKNRRKKTALYIIFIVLIFIGTGIDLMHLMHWW